MNRKKMNKLNNFLINLRHQLKMKSQVKLKTK